MVNGFIDFTVSLPSLQKESQETNKGGISFRLDLTALNGPPITSEQTAQMLLLSASPCERTVSPLGAWEGKHSLTPPLRTIHGANPSSQGREHSPARLRDSAGFGAATAQVGCVCSADTAISVCASVGILSHHFHLNPASA